MDNSSVGAGFMLVFAVSGSVAFLAHQIHKRILSDFMKNFEIELVRANKKPPKKRVRFAADVADPRDKMHPGRKWSLAEHGGGGSTIRRAGEVREFEDMPLNRQVLYKGIIESKGLKAQYI